MSNPVPNLDKALEEEGYVRWVQTGTCIGFAKKGLESFVSGRSRVLHQRIKHNVQNTSSYTNMCPNISVSRAKYNHTIPGSSNTHNWTMTCFPGCRDCQLYINELVSVCSGGFMFSKNHWENSNITNWPVSEWEVAKVYMNPGQDKNIQTAEDTDLSAILNFIEHCSVPYLAISNKQSIQKVRENRNVIMHSPTFTATPQQLQDFTNSMIDLLTDQTTLLYDKGAKEAVLQIKEAQSSNFTITTDAEFRVLRDRALELQKQNKTMQENVKYMQDQCDDLEGKDDEESQTTLAQLVKDLDERERNLHELKSTFSKLEHFASRKRDLKAKMTEHTTITAAALFETKEMLTNIKKSYRKLTNQEQDIIDEATDQYETVEEKYDALQKLTEALITENNDKKTENLALSTSKTETENRLIQKQQEIDDLNLTLQDYKKENETIEKNLNSVKAERDQFVTDNQNLRKELDTLVAAKRMQDELINDLRSEKITLETEIKETKHKLDVSLNKISTLTKNKDELELEIRSLKKQLELYQEELESIKLKQGETQAELQTLVSEKKQLVADKLKRDGKIIELQLQISQLETALLKSQNEGKASVKEIERINEENNILKLQIYDINEKMKKLKQTLEFSSKEIDRLSILNDDLKTETKELNEENSRFKKDIDGVCGLKQQNDKLKMTDTTIFRIWCLAIILYIIVFVTVNWDEVLQM